MTPAVPSPENPHRTAAAGTEPDSLDLTALGALVQRPDEHARTAGRALWKAAPGPGSHGALEDLSLWYAGCRGSAQPDAPRRVRVVVVAADAGMPAEEVSVAGTATGAAAARAVLDGSADVALAAAACGATVRLVDVGLVEELPGLEHGSVLAARRGTGRIDRTDAMSRAEAEEAFRAGMRIADEETDAGADLLVTGAVGPASSTAAAVLTGVLTRQDASAVTGRGAGIDDATWMRKCAAVRDAMRRARPSLGDPIGLLATGGGLDLAAMCGLLVQAAVRRTPVVIDGVVPATAALLAHRIAFRGADWWLAAHRMPDPCHAAALDRLGLTPLLDLRMRSGDGTGALLVVPVLRTAVAALRRLEPGPE